MNEKPTVLEDLIQSSFFTELRDNKLFYEGGEITSINVRSLLSGKQTNIPLKEIKTARIESIFAGYIINYKTELGEQKQYIKSKLAPTLSF